MADIAGLPPISEMRHNYIFITTELQSLVIKIKNIESMREELSSKLKFI